MSSFEKAFDKAAQPMQGMENLHNNISREVSPMLGSSEGNSIINSMRGSTDILPNGFPSFDNIFTNGQGAQNNPTAGAESILGGSSNGGNNPLSQIEGLIGGGNGSNNPLSQIEGMIGGGDGSSNPLSQIEGMLGGGNGSSNPLSQIEGMLGGNGSSNPLSQIEGMLGGNGNSNPLSQIEGMLGGNGSSNPLSQIEGLFGGGSGSPSPLGGLLGSSDGIGSILDDAGELAPMALMAL